MFFYNLTEIRERALKRSRAMSLHHHTSVCGGLPQMWHHTTAETPPSPTKFLKIHNRAAASSIDDDEEEEGLPTGVMVLRAVCVYFIFLLLGIDSLNSCVVGFRLSCWIIYDTPVFFFFREEMTLLCCMVKCRHAHCNCTLAHI